MQLEFEAICRTCLGNKTLHPIFKRKEYHERFSLALNNTTGLKVELNDGLPQHICIDCMLHINSSLKFQAKCKESETKLLEMCQVETQTFQDDKDSVENKIEENDMCQVQTLTFEDDIGENKMCQVTIQTFEDDKETVENEIEENVQSMDFHMKMDIDIDDVNPMIDLKQEYLEGSSERTIADNNKIKPQNITVLENKVIDINKYRKHLKNKKADIFINENPLKEDFILNNLKNENEVLTVDTNDTINADKLEEFKRRVTCKICKKSLSVCSLNAHMNKRHPEEDERKTKCELCDNYVFKKKFTEHVVLVHGNECTKCAYCEVEFSTRELLIDHVASSTCNKPKKSRKETSECEVCHKKMQRSSLKIHQKIQHAGLGPTCDICGRTFGNKLRLLEHLRARHDFAKYECKLCDFRSASQQSMRNHDRRHSGDKPYVCEMCGASFHAAYLLKQHLQSHRTDKPVKCTLCPAKFKTKNGLHMHKAACHSKTTYKCMLCDRIFRCRYYALKHLRKHGYTGPKCNFDLNNALNEF